MRFGHFVFPGLRVISPGGVGKPELIWQEEMFC